MIRRPLFLLVALLLLPRNGAGQVAVVELQQSGGVSTESTSGSSTQMRVFGEPARNLRFKVEGSFGRQFGHESDLLGTAYPYAGKADLIEAYAEYLLPERSFVRAVRGGRYRTPFGISAASEHAYIGFMRPPLIRYGEYWALSSGYLEQGAEIMVGISRVTAGLSVGRPADVGEALRLPGVDTVARVEASTDTLIVGASFINTTRYVREVWAHGGARFGGLDVRWMQHGIELRGEWLGGHSFAGTQTKGGYVDLIAHRPFMGPATVIGRMEYLDYDTIPRFAMSTSRYQAGLRVRVWQGLSVSTGLSHQAGHLTQRERTALDAGVSYSIQTRR